MFLSVIDSKARRKDTNISVLSTSVRESRRSARGAAARLRQVAALERHARERATGGPLRDTAKV